MTTAAQVSARKQAQTKQDYKDLLQISIDNERRRERKLFDTRGQDTLPQKPLELQKTAQDELSDAIKLRDRALKNLQSPSPSGLGMKGPDAAAVVQDLQASGTDLAEFVKYFGKFKDLIRGIDILTPAVFRSLWERFKEILLSQDDGKEDPVGLTIDFGSREYRAALEDVADRLDNLQLSLVPQEEMKSEQTSRATVLDFTQPPQLFTQQLSLLSDKELALNFLAVYDINPTLPNQKKTMELQTSDRFDDFADYLITSDTGVVSVRRLGTKQARTYRGGKVWRNVLERGLEDY